MKGNKPVGVGLVNADIEVIVMCRNVVYVQENDLGTTVGTLLLFPCAF